MFSKEQKAVINAMVVQQIRQNTQPVLHPPILLQTSQEPVGGGGTTTTPFPLQLVKADTSSAARVTVTAGYIAGFSISALTIALGSSGTYYIQAKVTVGYNTSIGLWAASSCGVPASSASITGSGSTFLYINLGTATVISNGTGGYRCSAVNPAVTGSVVVARIGNATTYVDYSWV